MDNHRHSFFQTILEMLNCLQAVLHPKNFMKAEVRVRRPKSIVSRSSFFSPHYWLKTQRWTENTSTENYFDKQSKFSFTSSPSTNVAIDEDSEPSSRALKQWSNPRRKKDRERRRKSERKRRERKTSGISIRSKRILGNDITDIQAARSGADMTQAKARASIIEDDIAKLNPSKQAELKQP